MISAFGPLCCGIFLNLLQFFKTFNIIRLEGILSKRKKKSKTKTLTVLGGFPVDAALV